MTKMTLVKKPIAVKRKERSEKKSIKQVRPAKIYTINKRIDKEE